MFKQLLMIACFDRYFQIAPCFRDEDARADRSPGEFYQLDFEMSFVTQDDVFAALQPVLYNVFAQFGKGRPVTPLPFPRIPYEEALQKYGIDKPDLRNPLLVFDVTEVFKGAEFTLFASAIEKGAVVRAIQGKGAAGKPRGFFDKMNDWAREQGARGLGYITFEDGEAKGPIAKFLDSERLTKLKQITGLGDGDAVFFACDGEKVATKLAGLVRIKLGEELDLIDKSAWHFCWVVDFPMFEYHEEQKKIDFSHNPFSMPQGGLQALETQDPSPLRHTNTTLSAMALSFPAVPSEITYLR